MGKSMEDYTQEINDLTDSNKAVYSELEEVTATLISKSTEMMKKQIKNRIEDTVKNNPEHTKELNNEGKLKQVKELMNETLENIGVYVKEEFAGGKVFIHRDLKVEKYKNSFEYSREVKEKCEEVYRILLGYAGNVICKFGYEKAGNDYNGHSTWKCISGSGGKIKYGAYPEIEEIESEWEEYTDLLKKFVDTVQKINSLIEAKEKSEVSDLWESI